MPKLTAKEHDTTMLLSTSEKRPPRKRTALEKVPSLLTVHCAIIAVQVAFGGGHVVGRLGLPSVNPILFALIREGIAGPLLCAFAFWYDRLLPDPKDFWLFFKPGFSLFLNQFFFIIGLKLSNSVTAAAWQPSQPIMAVLLGLCMGTEKNIEKWKVSGLCIGTGGALFMVLFHASYSGSVWKQFGGSFCFFMNCLATTLFIIYGRETLERYPAATVTGYSYICATIGMTVAITVVGSSNTVLNFLCKDCDGHAWHVPAACMYALAYWVIIQSGLTYGLITWVNQYADPSVNLAYTVLQPLTATVVSEVILTLGLVQQCHGHKDEDKTCLYAVSLKELGAIGIVIGLYCVIYSDLQYNRRLKAAGIAPGVRKSTDMTGIRFFGSNADEMEQEQESGYGGMFERSAPLVPILPSTEADSIGPTSEQSPEVSDDEVEDISDRMTQVLRT